MKRLSIVLVALVMTAGSLVVPSGVSQAGTEPGTGPATGAVRIPDPLQRGPYPIDRIEYDGGIVTVSAPPGVVTPERLMGSIHLPEREGPFPLVILVHGRHSTCEFVERVEFLLWPCPDARPATADVRSYEGYDYLAGNLASHGYVVASISANAINTFDLAMLDSGMQMRAHLVAHTLDLFSTWNKEVGPREVEGRLIGMIDFDRIGLMGHSRGGEGVARFVEFNRTRTDGPTYKGLRAVFALAPTDFDRQEVPGVHFGTLLPICDGDVYNLQGAWMYDDARYSKPERFARVQFTVAGANHNFFNTVWTYDDGEFGGDGQGTNPACVPDNPGSVRLDAQEQRNVGLALMGAFFRRYLGNDTRLDPLMTGGAGLPRGACPEKLSCSRVVGTSYVAPAAARRTVLVPQSDMYRAIGFDRAMECETDTTGAGCDTVPTWSTARQLSLEWTERAVIRIPVRDVGGFESVTLRAGMNFGSQLNEGIDEQSLLVALVDKEGRRSTVSTARFSEALRRPFGPDHQVLTLNGIRIPLRAFSGVDLDSIVRLDLIFGETTRRGSVQILDIAFQGR